MEPFEQDLPDVQSWCFWLLHDWRYIDFQTGHFADIEWFKIVGHLSDLGHVKFDLTHSFYLLTLGKTLGREKQSKTSSFDKKFKNQA